MLTASVEIYCHMGFWLEKAFDLCTAETSELNKFRQIVIWAFDFK